MSDHYTILNLPFTESPIPKQELKLAYHRALLRHHPDKTATATATPDKPRSDENENAKYTVDAITTAYKTLSIPSLRSEYNRSLRLDRLKHPDRSKTDSDEVFHTGLETVDLEDLTEQTTADDEMSWSRACRCGDEGGFLVTEADLDREADHGELVVGCRGCSLYMRVLFAVE